MEGTRAVGRLPFKPHAHPQGLGLNGWRRALISPTKYACYGRAVSARCCGASMLGNGIANACQNNRAIQIAHSAL
jgi:hypothetical protein